VPWRFSDAGRWSVLLDRRYRRPKTCTGADISSCRGRDASCLAPPGQGQLDRAGLRLAHSLDHFVGAGSSEAPARQDTGCERLMTVPGICGCIRSRLTGLDAAMRELVR
jgi:hypothetical protein